MADSPLLAPDQTTVTVPADTGGAKTLDPPAVSINEMSKPERETFLKDGTVPSKKPDAAAASSPAAPDAQAAETAALPEPASEPGKPTKKARNSEERRVEELLTERQRERQRADRAERDADDLRKRLDALEQAKPDATRDPSTPPAHESAKDRYKRLAKHPDAPKAADFEDLDEYAAVMAGFVNDQVGQERIDAALSKRDATQGQQAQQMRDLEAVATKSADRIDAERAKDPSLVEKIHQGFRDLPPARLLPSGTAAGPHHFAKDVIMFESEHPLALSAFYSGSEAGMAEWQRLMSLSAGEIQREIAYRDVSFRSTSAPVAKPFTNTPAPPPSLGHKPGAVVDKAKAAEGNFAEMLAHLDAQEGRETPRRRRA